MLTFGSLFSGIGGIDLGLERAGLTCSWQVEIDSFCRDVLDKNFPHTLKFDDVKQCGKHNLKPVDLICGGFPCQDISIAGKGVGLHGKKSKLWFEFERIIREMGPKFIIVENVPNLRRRGLTYILGTLSSLGYDSEWSCLSASQFGAKHRRKRVFIVAYTNGFHTKRRRRCEHLGRTKQKIEVPNKRSITVNSNNSLACRDTKIHHTYSPQIFHRKRKKEPSFEVEPNVGRMVDGLSNQLDSNKIRKLRLKSLGNSLIPQIAEYIGLSIVDIYSNL
jgi:DNA (cytosine-5)-methyltransferase 1